MKTIKNKIVKNSKIGILCLGISIFLWNCTQKEEDFFVPQQSIGKIEKISFKDLPSSLSYHINTTSPNTKIAAKNSNETLIIDESQIMKLVDSLKNTKYAIKFSISNQPNNVLYNLVLGKDKNNQEIQAKVIKYTISNMDESYQNGRINFSKIKGEISVFPFANFLSYFNTSTKIKHRMNTRIPCKSFSSTSNGGGGGGDIQNPNGDNSLEYGGGSISGTTIILPPFLQQKAQYIDCRMNTWSNGKTGEIILVTWSCTDGTSGVIEYEKGKPIYNKGGDIPNCDSIGAVPINEGDDEAIDFIFEEPDTPIINMANYLKCFDLTKPAQFTIYVDQPIANQDDSWTGGKDKAGHAFISITQGGLTRSWGLYPEGDANPFKPSDPHAFGDNSQDEFDVSITLTINRWSLLNIINDAKNYNLNYNLNSNNCTDYVIQAAELAGITLPDPQSTWPKGGGSNPGAFGQSLRAMTSTNGMVINRTTGIAPQNTNNCN